MSDSVRAYLRDQLSLPEWWNVIEEQRFPDTISKTTVILQHTRIERLPEAPMGCLRHTITLSVLDPHTDIATAENELDDALVTLIGAIDSHSTISWSSADKTLHENRYAGWNLTLTVITNTTEEEA